jgi:hypothetical protein
MDIQDLTMRTVYSALIVASAVTLAMSSGSIAAPIDASAIKAAADEISISESVHCRPFRHPHRWGYGRGCRGDVMVYDRGPRVRARIGIGVREGYRTRERNGVTIRSQERSTIRSGTRDRNTVGGNETIRRGNDGAGETSPRVNRGAGQPREGVGGNTDRRMNTVPTGQRQGQGGGGQGTQGTTGSPGAARPEGAPQSR